MKQILTGVLLVTGFLCAFGQVKTGKSIFYKTDAYTLTNRQKKQLDTYLDSALKTDTGIHKIIIYGYTDSSAGKEYNIALSIKRAENVEKYLLEKYKRVIKADVRGEGEEHPVYPYNNGNAMAMNRRVDIIIDKHREKPAPSIAVERATTIVDLYKLLDKPADTFLVDNNKDTVLKATNGTVVVLPAHCFCDETGRRIKVAVKEVLKKSDMISQNTSTGAGLDYLVTDGMVQLTAWDMRGNELKQCKKDNLSIMIPTENPDKDMQLFYASRDIDYALDWKNKPENKMRIIEGRTFRKVLMPYERQDFNEGMECHLFFCKIRRFFRELFEKPLVINNEQVFMNKQDAKIYQGYQTIRDNRNIVLSEIASSYRTADRKSMEDVTLDDGYYYIFNSPGLGWSNCDRYAYNAANMSNVKTPVKYDKTTDLKLVMVDDKVVIPSHLCNDSFCFTNVPKQKKAKLIGLKYENGTPYFAMQEITTGDAFNADLKFEKHTLEEIKQIISSIR